MSSDAAVAFALLVPSAALAMSTLISASASASPSVLATPKTLRVPGPSSTMASSASTPTCRSLPVQHDLTTPRARARAARLRANEAAERREDLAALITTPVSQCHPTPFIRPPSLHSFARPRRHNGRSYAARSRASKRNSPTSTGCRGTRPGLSSSRHQHQHQQHGREGQEGGGAHRRCAALWACMCSRWTMARCAPARGGNGDVSVSVHGLGWATMTLNAHRRLLK